MIFSLVLAALVFAYIGFVRNQQVYDFRIKMLNTVHDNNKSALMMLPGTPGMTVERVEEEGKRMLAKYDTMEQVGYFEMLLKFWKPLKPEAWYTDTSFLK